MIQNINDIIISTLKEFHPERIGIFGSFAREENKPESDIDILVKFKNGITLLQLIKLENDLTEKLGIKVDLVTEGAITNKKLKKSIQKDLKIILK
jgi:uncharacterized protein